MRVWTGPGVCVLVRSATSTSDRDLPHAPRAFGCQHVNSPPPHLWEAGTLELAGGMGNFTPIRGGGGSAVAKKRRGGKSGNQAAGLPPPNTGGVPSARRKVEVLASRRTHPGPSDLRNSSPPPPNREPFPISRSPGRPSPGEGRTSLHELAGDADKAQGRCRLRGGVARRPKRLLAEQP